MLSDTSNILELPTLVLSCRAPKCKCAPCQGEHSEADHPRGRHLQKLATSIGSLDTTLEPPLNQKTPPYLEYLFPICSKVGLKFFNKYIERNITFTEQKAIGLSIFAVAVFEGSGVLDACKMAAKFTGFNSEVILRWAVNVFLRFHIQH